MAPDSTDEHDGGAELSPTSDLRRQICFSTDALESFGENIADKDNRSEGESLICRYASHPVRVRYQVGGRGQSDAVPAWGSCRRHARKGKW